MFKLEGKPSFKQSHPIFLTQYARDTIYLFGLVNTVTFLHVVSIPQNLCHFSAQISNWNSCRESTNIWLWLTNTFPVALTKKKKADVRETAKLPPAVSVITGTPINSAVDFLYSTSLLSRYMTLSSTASTCATPWKMWLIKVFSAICKFLGNSDFCDIFNAHQIYSLIFSCTLKCESHWTFIWMLIWQISLLFVQLRILKMVRNTFFKFTLQSILCTLQWF